MGRSGLKKTNIGPYISGGLDPCHIFLIIGLEYQRVGISLMNLDYILLGKADKRP